MAITTAGDAALLNIDVGFNPNLSPGLAGRILDSRAQPIQEHFLGLNTPVSFLASDTSSVTIPIAGPSTISEAWSYVATGTDLGLSTYSVDSLNFTGPPGQSINYVGTITELGGTYTSIDYTILHDDATTTTTVSYTGNMERGINGIVVGGTINSISITNGVFTVEITGTLTLDSQGEIASGTVTAYTFSDGTNSISATDVSVPWSTFDAASFNDLGATIPDGLGGTTTNPRGGVGRLYEALTEGNDTFGEPGTNIMIGGLGDDTYNVDDLSDTVTELAAEGDDTVITELSGYTLAANVENLTLIGTADASATGNDLDNVITGNIGNNTIDGSTGTDTYVLSIAKADVTDITESGGVYTIVSALGTDVLTSIEALSFTDDNLSPTAFKAEFDAEAEAALLAGPNTFPIDGVATNMAGGPGDDIYNVDDAGDIVTELLNEGDDTVITTLDNYTLADNVENLTLTGTANLVASGNALANTITGNSGNNTIDGGAGADTMAGGLGDDTYTVDNAGDVVTEDADEGTDTVITALNNYTLAANVENLTLTGTDNLTATGNALDNTIIGNTGNNAIDGGAGADTMAGGLGDDTYTVDNAGDVVTEDADEGTDTVITALNNYTLAANVDNLTLTGNENLTTTGNALANTIIGNNGNNAIDGGAGADTMVGGLGDDTYTLDNAGDVVTENEDEGNDTVITALNNYTLAANVENLTLTGSANLDATGNALDNVITGNTGNNAIDGGDGNDTFVFGVAQSDVSAISFANGMYTITRSAGTDDLTSIEMLSFTDADITPEALLALLTPEPTGPTITVNGVTQTAEAYTDPNVPGLAYRFVGTNNDQTTQPDVVTGTAFGDLINLLAGDDAADGGDGDDVLDGGTGSNFLTGGNGNDTFFVDGRGNTGTTWSTITDFTTGDQATLWGWVDGTSQLIETVENGGATGFTGATFHYDLDNDGLIETSITFTGLAVADVPTPTSGIVETNPFLFFVA